MEHFDISTLSYNELIHRLNDLCDRLREIEFSLATPEEINENGVNTKSCINLIQEIDQELKRKRSETQ